MIGLTVYKGSAASDRRQATPTCLSVFIIHLVPSRSFVCIWYVVSCRQNHTVRPIEVFAAIPIRLNNYEAAKDLQATIIRGVLLEGVL
jgi:hypothetical protein